MKPPTPCTKTLYIPCPCTNPKMADVTTIVGRILFSPNCLAIVIGAYLNIASSKKGANIQAAKNRYKGPGGGGE